MNKVDMIPAAQTSAQTPAPETGKFAHPDYTADGQTRASVPLTRLSTLWFNTGTLCNIECLNCYIKSSPTNDQLVYITTAEVCAYLDEIATLGEATEEIAFTGGEPFMNPDMIDIARACLERGYRVLILTNAMRPMMRKSVQAGLLALHKDYGARMVLRISLDHFDPDKHEAERGKGSYAVTITGMKWLRDNGFTMAVAGRAIWNTDGENDGGDEGARAGYAALFAQHRFAIDAFDTGACVLFPEMDEAVDVPEITTACWGILGKSPKDIMCASSRMVVKRKGASRPAVVACTLLPYSAEFELGDTLARARGAVKLNHPHCAKFCVLGGASCSG